MPPREIGVRARFLFCLLFWAGIASGQPDHRLITAPEESAQPAARELLRRLADGDIEAAARLSNAPERRLEVLRDYRDAVGEAAFKAVYARYFRPANRVLAEAAIGPRRLLIWQLGEEDNQLAGQFFVQVDGQFLLDDVPSEARADLQRVLQHYRERNQR